MSKNGKWIVIGAAAAAAVLAAGIILYNSMYVSVGGSRISRDAETVNLSGAVLNKPEKLAKLHNPRQMDLRGTGMSAEDYALLKEAFPACEILWDVPFQGNVYSMDTEYMTVTSLSEVDASLLDCLPNLKTVDAWGCTDYENLLAYQHRHPNVQVQYYVDFGDGKWSSDVDSVTAPAEQIDGVAEKLALLPRVSKVTLTGKLPEYAQVEALAAQYPNVEISWQTELAGRTVSKESEKLDLTGMPLTANDVRALLPFFPSAQTVVIRGCGLTDDEGLALMQENPGKLFVWDIEICGMTFSTDTHEIDISGVQVERPTVVEELLPYFPNVTKVVMSECGVDSETMEAMNLRHDDVQFVWSIYLNNLLMRTDATWFMPVKFDSFVTDEHLKEFHYFHNMEAIDLGHMGVTHCEWVREMPNIRFLLLADTGMKDISPVTGLEKLEYLELFQTYIQDVTPITTCPNLKALNLCYVYCDPTPLVGMTDLDMFWWLGNTECPKILTQDKFPNTDLHVGGDGSSTGDGWREGKLYYEMRDIFGMWYMIG